MSNPEKPDVRKVAQDIRVALGSYSKEQLIEMLTHVFQSYVVEGPAPVAAAQPERLPELEGMPFARLIETLQLRLDAPELALFVVEGARVQVKIQGILQPLSGGADERALPLPATPAQPPTAAAQAPGVGFIDAPMRPGAVPIPPVGRLVGADEMRFHEQRIAEQRAQAPRPTRGVSVSGNSGPARSGGAPAQPPAAGQGAAPAAGQGGSGAAPAQPAAKKDLEIESDAAARSRLLEID
jgi:hypothetical protein